MKNDNSKTSYDSYLESLERMRKSFISEHSESNEILYR